VNRRMHTFEKLLRQSSLGAPAVTAAQHLVSDDESSEILSRADSLGGKSRRRHVSINSEQEGEMS
jgi:hypothetical protein